MAKLHDMNAIYLLGHLYSNLVCAMSPLLSLTLCPISGLVLTFESSFGKIVSA